MRTALLAESIEKRRPLADRIEKVQGKLQEISSLILELENQRGDIMKLDDPDVSGRLADIDLSTIQSKIAVEIDALEKLRRRFIRDTLNIGVVGRARQGKSRFLQSISGLNATHIPDGDRQHCTGVRSTILHNPSVHPYGEVFFYTERAFINEILTPYYRELNLSPLPMSISDFATKPLPALSLTERSGHAEPKAKYDHLKKYHQHINNFKPLLSAPSPRTIPPEEIREYVAQDTLDGERIYFHYLAVREVRIVCKFPHEDVGKIALIDMPGLGDTGIGDQERLIKTLGEDVDIVLFIRLPKTTGDHWADVDVALYDLARRALPELPIEQWSFMILNRVAPGSKEDNLGNCQDLKDTFAAHHMDVVDMMIADCSNAAEVGQSVVDPVITYLVEKITDLDRQYAANHQEIVNNLAQEIKVQVGKACQALGTVSQSSDEHRLFAQLFDEVWDELTTGLEKLVAELAQHRSQNSVFFKQQVDKAIEACRTDTGIPTVEEIETRRNRVGSYDIAYNEYLHEVRTRLTRHFAMLEDALDDLIEEIKLKVVNVLTEQGKLGPLAETQSSAFLGEVAALMPDDMAKLREPLQTLAMFTISYRVFIQYRLRRCLDKLVPDTTPIKLSPRSSAPDDIEQYLKTLHSETIYAIQNAFEEWLSDPNDLAFAIVEEFVDQILRAEKVKRDWNMFYHHVRADIWPSEFQKLGEQSRIRLQWQTAVDRLSEVSQEDALRFL